MKLHVSVEQPPLAGFLNIDAAQQSIDLGNLDNFCENSECTEIVINDVLKFIPHNKIPDVIHHIYNKMRHDAKATIIFTDCNSVIREYNRGNINENKLNELLYNGARSCFSYDYILRIIKAIKLNILEINISTEQVVIIIERS